MYAANYIRNNSENLTEQLLPRNNNTMLIKFHNLGQPARGAKQQFGRKLQHALSNCIQHRQWTDLSKSSSNRSGHSKRLARVRSCMLDGTHRWLTAPLNDHNLLSDYEFNLCIKLRLGLPLVKDLPDRCPFCSADCSFDGENCDHLLSCKASNSFIDRHDDIVQTLKRIANEYTRARAEPPPDRRMSSAIRPDLRIRHLHGTYFTDVRVVHPCAPSYVDQSSRDPGHALRTAARVKSDKYKGYAAYNAGTFHPFIVSTFGAMEMNCSSYFDLIRKFGADSSPSNPSAGPEAVGTARAAVAVAIQRAVARATLDAIQHALSETVYQRDTRNDRAALPARQAANAFLAQFVPR